MPRVKGRSRWRPVDGEEGWMLAREPGGEHVCLPPSLADLYHDDIGTWMRDWVWRCPVCERFYRAKHNSDESMFVPTGEWVRVWPWQVKRLRQRWDRLHPR